TACCMRSTRSVERCGKSGTVRGKETGNTAAPARGAATFRRYRLTPLAGRRADYLPKGTDLSVFTEEESAKTRISIDQPRRVVRIICGPNRRRASEATAHGGHSLAIEFEIDRQVFDH